MGEFCPYFWNKHQHHTNQGEDNKIFTGLSVNIILRKKAIEIYIQIRMISPGHKTNAYQHDIDYYPNPFAILHKIID